MALAARLLRALGLFAWIFASYLAQWGLERALRRPVRGDAGDERLETPAFLAERRARIDLENARLLRDGMLGLRGVYIKLGQVLSIMGGFLPRVYTRELESLQDQVPPHSFREIRRVMRASLGRPPEQLFVTIEHAPVAAASLGQVHVAVLADGRKCAVKVLYPGIREQIAVDMRVVRLAITVYNWFIPVRNISAVYDALVDLLRRETDYLHEAACMRRVATNFAGQDDIVVPEVIDALTSREVLTMSFVEGIKITHVDRFAAAGIDRHAVAQRLTECFYEQLFVHRFFHADPHPGNFLVQAGERPDRPRIVILDYGAISEVDDATVDGMVDVLQGFFEQREELVLRGFHRIGFVAEQDTRALVDRTVLTYFRKLLHVKERTPAALMRADPEQLRQLADPEAERGELRALMRAIRYPDGWFYVERASVLMFWLVGQIDPDLDMTAVGFPYVLPLLAERTEDSAGRFD